MTKAQSLEAANRDAYFKTTQAPGPLDVKVGDEVCYTRYFLKQITNSPTDPLWFERGKVIRVKKHNIVIVRWNDGREVPVKTHALAFPDFPNTRAHD